MSCNLIYGENKKLKSVVADNNQPSLLYKEALNQFGADQALNIYLASKSDDFQDNIILSQNELDVNNEPKLKTVLNYLSLQNESKEPLTIQQKIDLRNISLGVENFSVQKLIKAFYSDGIFNISPKKLKKSGLYSDYEITNLANDTNLQQTVKQSLEALKNTEEVDLDTEFVEGLEKTDEVNSFGKLVSLNPNLVQKEILNKLAATTEEQFENNLADLEYPNFQKSLNKKVSVEEVNDKFDIKEDSEEDRITLSVENVGSVVIQQTFPEYEFLEDITEKQADKLGVEEGDFISKIEDIRVDDTEKSKGFGRKLLNKALQIIEARNEFPVYLNASPMGSRGLNLEDLTNFYKSFGFKVFKKQGGNNLMLLKKEDLKLTKPSTITKKEQLFQEMQGYKKAEVFMEVDGEIVQAKNTNTAVVLPLVAKQINNVEILLDINQIQQYDLDILQANQEDTVRILKGIEDNLIEQGIDVAGLSDREINADLMSFISNLEIFINEPSIENTKAFADVYDTYFEKDLSPKTEIVKQSETDRDFVKLNTNLSEEQVYEQQGLIKVKDGLYIRTNKQDLETLYTSLETYTDKYPKETPLKEYVQTQIATLEDFKNSDNAEAVYLYKIHFDLVSISETDKAKNNGTFMKAPNGKPTNLTEQQWITVRTPEFKAWFGDWQNSPQNASKVVDENGEPLVVYHGSPYSGITSFDRKQSAKREFGLKEYGTYFATNKTLSEAYKSWSKLDNETLINIDKEINKWKEVRDSVRNNREFNAAEEKIKELENSKKGKVYSAFLNLKKIKEFDADGGENVEAWNKLEVKASYKWAKNRDAMEFLKEGTFGVEKVDGIHAKNIVDAFVQGDEKLRKDFLGDVYLVFDGNERMIKSASEILETTEEETNDIRFLKKVTPTKNNANFTGNFEYLTTDFVSDFYIEMLKEREKDSEIYKNFYSNFDINENGIYLKNDDSITMSQIKEYADENLKQYSIISKQMPLLVEQEIQSETKQVRRDAILNNPQNLEKYQGQFHKLNDNTIITKNANDEFIKVEGNIFEAIDSDGNLTLYSRLNNIVGEYYNFNNEAPKSSVKIEDYSYLNTQPDSFMSEKKYLSKSAKEKINKENFDCI